MRRLLLISFWIPTLFWPQESRADALQDLWGAVRSRHPASQITGNFWDWRTTSRYRSRAGIHGGYDFSAPRGTPIVTPWAGKVTALVPWSGGEFGVQLEVGAYSVTFGHLVPTVVPGSRVSCGRLLGFVARDHLDVKIRDAQGRLVDARLLPSELGVPRPPIVAALKPFISAPTPPAPAPVNQRDRDEEREKRRLIQEGVWLDDEPLDSQ